MEALYFDGIFVKAFSGATPQPIIYADDVSLMVGAKASTEIRPTGYLYYHHIQDVSICRLIEPENTFFTGEIDEIIVWDKILTKLEASSLYHNGADILYESDSTPPPNPTLQLENTRDDIFSNKAYFTLNTCSEVSGVLVNEGTMPDKQDDRWEVCRTRRGSFGLEDLTSGGHTITAWFKDLAGNISPTSSDLVVDYSEVIVPYANAFWPLDANATVAHYARDVVENGVHDLIMTNINTPSNPSAMHVAGKVNEGIDLVGSQSYLTTPITTLLSPVNFLILDEPTNHLDIFSRNVLQEALEKYPGTLVLISHDEQLLSALVETVYEVQGGQVNLFQGSFEYYLRKKQEKIRRMLEAKQTDSNKTKSPRELENARKRREAAERKEKYRKQKKIQVRIDRVERKLLPLEEKREELEGLLGDPAVLSDSTRIMELQREHSYVCKEIEGYQEMWNELAEMMDEES